MICALSARLIPLTVALVVAAVLAFSLVMSLMRRARGEKIAPRTSLTYLAAFVIVVGLASLLLPVRLHAFIVVAVVAALVGVVVQWLPGRILLDATLLRARRSIRVAVAHPADHSLPNEPTSDPWPQYARSFERAGFAQLTNTGNLIVLFRSADSAFAQIAAPTRRGQPPILEMTSVLLRKRAVLRTSTFEPDSLRLWATELQQVFPGATPEKLMEDHEAALRFLAERGITSDTFDTDIAASVRAEMMRLEALAFSSNSLRTIRKETLRAARRTPADIGPLQAQPDIDARLGAFWSAVRTN